MVNAEHVGGTRGSGFVTSAADVLWISAVLHKSHLNTCQTIPSFNNNNNKCGLYTTYLRI